MRSTLFLCSLVAVSGCFSPNFGNTPGFYCHADDNPACPDGQKCINGRCVSSSSGALSVEKVGTPYNGMKLDPMLGNIMACPDYNTDTQRSLEPNDKPDTSVSLLSAGVAPEMLNTRVMGLAICPRGNNPTAAPSTHDADFYKLDTTNAAASSMTIVAQIFYDISYGDLDVAVLDGSGHMMASDGTAISNGCVAASLGKGVYYVAVVGANNMDVNRYELKVRTSTGTLSCSSMTTGPMDMASSQQD